MFSYPTPNEVSQADKRVIRLHVRRKNKQPDAYGYSSWRRSYYNPFSFTGLYYWNAGMNT